MKTIFAFVSALQLTLSVCLAQSIKPITTAPKSSVTTVTGKTAITTKANSTTTSGLTTKSSSTSAIPAVKPAPAPVSSAVSTTSGNFSLRNLINQALKDDSSRTAKQAGHFGVGLTYFLSGSLMAGVMVKQRAAYYTVGVGLYANKTNAFTPVNDVLFYGGGGLITSRQVSVGGYLSMTMVSSPTYVSTPTGYEASTRKTPTFGLGVAAGYQLNHVLITANLHNQYGFGLGATYFF